MNKRLTILLLMIAICINGYSQKWKLTRYEAHFGLGTLNVFGDIGGTADKNNLFGLKDIRIKETGLSFYTGARYKINPDMALKLNFIYGFTKGSDVGSKNEVGRNFSYKTSLFEPSVQYEYYFIKEDKPNSAAILYNRRGMMNNFAVITAYGFIGVGGVLFSPKVNFTGRPPLDKIETVSGYGKFAPVIPIGIGAKMALDKFWSIGFEFGRRIVFSDYLDGLSTTFSKSNDTYYFGTFHAIYKLETDRYGVPLIFKKSRNPYKKRR
jgi:hypothetical protein